MNFLLVALNAKYIHSNPALYSLKSYAGALSKHVRIAEFTINQSTEEILESIYFKKPDVIGISCYIWNWGKVREILSELPEILPWVPVWLGGPEVSFDGEEILKEFPRVAGIMEGEGEETFRELLSFYVERESAKNGDADFSQIPGLMLRTGRTGYRKPLSLDSIPFLYEDLAPFQNRILYYESQRGCPFSCAYCLSSIDKSVRFRNVDTVKKELRFFLDRKVKQVKFVDRTFNCNARHATEIWQFLLENDNGVTNFHFELAGDLLTGEELKILSKMRPGLVQAEIGVQSVNPKTLAEINRSTDLEKLKEVVRQIRENGNIHVHLDLIAGLPYEDYESFAHSFNEVYAMEPEQLQLGFLKVLKGSPMQENAEKYGLVYRKNPPYEVLSTRWISYEELRRLKRVEQMVEIYYNSNQFSGTLPHLIRRFASPFAFFEALSDYYAKHGLFTETPSRIYRYKVLLDFAEDLIKKADDDISREGGERQEDASFLAACRELLIYDLYRRENLKSRPDFAPDEKEDRERIREIYHSNQKMPQSMHIEFFRYRVWDQNVTELSQKTPVLFDYENRSPLTHDARVTVLEEV